MGVKWRPIFPILFVFARRSGIGCEKPNGQSRLVRGGDQIPDPDGIDPASDDVHLFTNHFFLSTPRCGHDLERIFVLNRSPFDLYFQKAFRTFHQKVPFFRISGPVRDESTSQRFGLEFGFVQGPESNRFKSHHRDRSRPRTQRFLRRAIR